MDQERDRRLAEVAGIAARLSMETRVPRRLIVAAWAVESEWGAEPTGHANYFGIKRAARHALFSVSTTHEFFTQTQVDHWNQAHPDRPARIDGRSGGTWRVELDDEFADYASLEESVRDYCWLISHGAPYALAWLKYLADRSVDSLIDAVAQKYSTAGGYAGLVTTIAKQANVLAALEAAAREAA